MSTADVLKSEPLAGPDEPPLASAKSILVVDDDEIELEIMIDTLAAAFPGADVCSTGDPLTAAELCSERRFDCVLLDYNMPQIDGLTLAAELRYASAYLPIVLMTSVGDEMLAARALRSGASDYIPKSRINPESIRRSVARSIHAATQARLIHEQRSELETFAYALAHDFKQPIRQITTFTQLISEGLTDGKIERVQQHLDFLNTAARRLSKLVDVMSQYTLLNQPPELGDVDLNKVLSGIRASIAPYLAEKSGELIWTGHTALLRGNETLTAQVLQNLILNGLTYNENEHPTVRVTVLDDGACCTIQVSDDGIGIESTYIVDIFKPLVRLHTAAEYPGSGLGLTLARKAVLAQQGSIWCESELGKGSTFYVKLPLAQGLA